MKTPEHRARELYGTSMSDDYSIKLSELHQSIFLRGYRQCEIDNTEAEKEQQKQALIDMMKADEKDGIYEPDKEMVKCFFENESWGLTYGKQYEVISRTDKVIRIVNDKGQEDIYYASNFK